MRLIDADALKRELCDFCLGQTTEYERCDRCMTTDIIDRMPSADTGQLAHWIPGKRGKWKCSCCGNEIYCTSPDDLQRNHEFCGHCGAEMKEQCDMRTLIEEVIL